MSTSSISPGLDVEEEALLERFLDVLWTEHGLSDHTLAAYRADLKGVALFFKKRAVSLASAQRQDLLSYLTQRVKAGARPRTTSRLLSSLRRFYRDWDGHCPRR
jgi:integrase/recombinase XerD